MDVFEYIGQPLACQAAGRGWLQIPFPASRG